MDPLSHDPVAFFAEHAGRHLAVDAPSEPWEAASAVFNRAYPYAMPMAEYARKTLRQARAARGVHRRQRLASLARYAIVDAVIARRTGDATAHEREALRTLREKLHGDEAPSPCPPPKRPAVGSVVVARADRAPFAIANVRWASDRVEQRWMHQDGLGALVGRLAERAPPGPFVIAVAGSHRFSPARLAFSARGYLAICRPERTEYVDTERLRRLRALLAGARPPKRAMRAFRRLCRERALTAHIAPLDRELLALAREWGRDVHALHALLLRATDLEIEALGLEG